MRKKKINKVSFNNPLKVIDTKKGGDLTVLLHKKVHNVIQYIMLSQEYYKKEWQFMFRVDMSDPKYYKICDYFIIDQYNGGSTTRSTDNFREGMTAWIFENDLEDYMNEWCGWYHSHNTMQTFRSQQDKTTMCDHLEGADIQFSLVSGIASEEGANTFDGINYRCAINIARGYDVMLDDVAINLYSDKSRDTFSEKIEQINQIKQQKERDLAQESSKDIKSILKGFVPAGLPIRKTDEYNARLDEIQEERNKQYVDLLNQYPGESRYLGDIALDDLLQAEKAGSKWNKENNKTIYSSYYQKKGKKKLNTARQSRQGSNNLFINKTTHSSSTKTTCSSCGMNKYKSNMTLMEDGTYVCRECMLVYGLEGSSKKETLSDTNDDLIPVYKRPLNGKGMDICDGCGNYITLGEDLYSCSGSHFCQDCYGPIL